MGNKVKKQIFLENLKTNHKGIDWEKSIGYIVKFIYGDTEGEFTILEYDKITKKLKIKYNDDDYYIKTTGFKTCAIGNIINVWTSDYKYNIGYTYNNLIITDKYKISKNRKDGNINTQKWYKYTCNTCGWTDGNIIEGSIVKNIGCSCCSGKAVVEGINDIPTTAPWMVKYFQGGYDEAKMYTKNSGKKLNFICPFCGVVKNKKISINDLNASKSISCICGDGFSYPEKFVYNIFSQLNINFQTQLTKTTFDWCKNFRYDFYLPSLNTIIEVHGMQHYKESTRGRTLKEEQENDRFKKELALKNGIDGYIELDCRYSELEYIKTNILNSKLNELLDLSSIDWLKCEEFALKNLVKEVCDYLEVNPSQSYYDIESRFNISNGTIRKYVEIGINREWCNGVIDAKKKKVLIFKNDKLLDEYESTMELERQSINKYGVKLFNTHVSKFCNGKYPKETYKGFTFKYVEKIDKEAV